ncbi:MAG: hypothetical protein QME51_08115 [Planctomycetota bacterium]|nr:hypothetical protein [Planctomycetota bacterium]
MIENIANLQDKVKRIKAKIVEAVKSPAPTGQDQSRVKELRALRKTLKRTQRKVRVLTGKKLSLGKGETKKEKPSAPAPVAQLSPSDKKTS